MGDTAKVVGQQEVGPCPGRRHPPTTSSGPSHLSPMLPVYSVTYVPRLLRQSWRVSQAKSRSANRGFALFAPPCDIRLFPLACPVDEWPKVVHETFYVDLDPPDPASPFVWRQRPISDLSRICPRQNQPRSEEHTSELQSHLNLVCRLLLEKKKKKKITHKDKKKKKTRQETKK